MANLFGALELFNGFFFFKFSCNCNWTLKQPSVNTAVGRGLAFRPFVSIIKLLELLKAYSATGKIGK